MGFQLIRCQAWVRRYRRLAGHVVRAFALCRGSCGPDPQVGVEFVLANAARWISLKSEACEVMGSGESVLEKGEVQSVLG